MFTDYENKKDNRVVPEISRYVVDLRNKKKGIVKRKKQSQIAPLVASLRHFFHNGAKNFFEISRVAGNSLEGFFLSVGGFVQDIFDMAHHRLLFLRRRKNNTVSLTASLPPAAVEADHDEEVDDFELIMQGIDTSTNATSREHRQFGGRLRAAREKLRTRLFSHPLAKPVAVFAVAGFAVFLPIQIVVMVGHLSATQQAIEVYSQDALTQLEGAVSAFSEMNTEDALALFQAASEQFASIADMLSGTNRYLLELAKIVPTKGRTVQSYTSLLEAGKEFSLAGELLALGLRTDTDAIAGRVQHIAVALREASPHITAAREQLVYVRASDIPESARPAFAEFQQHLPRLEKAQQELLLVANTFSAILGDEKQKQRYLVIFQNNAELRATGGFISGVAMVDMVDGKIVRMEVPEGGAYDFKGYFTKHVASPLPLHVVNPVWQLQDANWSPDFPTAAKKIMWFFENTVGGYSLDGVIALTPQLLQDFLTITGPVDFPEYNTVIDKDNVVQAIEDASVAGEEKPKQFLSDLAPNILERALSLGQGDALDVFAAVTRALSSRHMLVYTTDEAVQSALATLGWTGAVQDAPQDYLYIVRSNIAGGKTDDVIEERVRHTVRIAQDGLITVRLELYFAHKGLEGAGERGIKNNNYLRVYVPEGSRLIAAEGFSPETYERLYKDAPEGYAQDEDVAADLEDAIVHEKSGTRIHTELGKTVFSNWVGVEPGKSGNVVLEYMLPFSLFSDDNDRTGVYTLYMQKQPGVRPSLFTSDVVLPDAWDLQRVVGAQATPSGMQLETVFKKDRWYGAVVKR